MSDRPPNSITELLLDNCREISVFVQNCFRPIFNKPERIDIDGTYSLKSKFWKCQGFGLPELGVAHLQ
jgi:hypothetical protein